MKMAIVWLALAGSLALPAASTAAPAQTQSSATQSAAKPTFEQKLQLFMSGVLQTGQPNATCGTPGALSLPGHSVSAPGSAFNPDGVSGQVYAGEQPQNSKNPKSVAQYDVACTHTQSPQ